jgi:hypothetical protein
MRRGFFFTLDVSVSLLLIMLVAIISFSYFGKINTNDFDTAVQYSYLQDASTVLVKKGCIQSLFCESGAPDISCASEVLRATPDSLCMSLSGYSVVAQDARGVMVPSPPQLLFSVDKQGCAYDSGAVQTLYYPFSCDGNQTGSTYLRAVIKAWQKGAG